MAGHLVKRTHRHRYFPRFSPFAFADPSLVVVVAAATATCAFLAVVRALLVVSAPSSSCCALLAARPRCTLLVPVAPSLLLVHVCSLLFVCAFLLVYVLALVLPTFAPSSLHFVYSLFLVPRFVSSSSFAPFSHFILGTIYVGFALYASYSPKPTHLLD
jgi:hypothetical protein